MYLFEKKKSILLLSNFLFTTGEMNVGLTPLTILKIEQVFQKQAFFYQNSSGVQQVLVSAPSLFSIGNPFLFPCNITGITKVFSLPLLGGGTQEGQPSPLHSDVGCCFELDDQH